MAKPGRPSYRNLFVMRFRGQLEDAELGAILENLPGRLKDIVTVTRVKRLEVAMKTGETEYVEI